MASARRQPTIYRLPMRPQPNRRQGRPPLFTDEELSRLRAEIATEVLTEMFGTFMDGTMTAADLIKQLADRIRER